MGEEEEEKLDDWATTFSGQEREDESPTQIKVFGLEMACQGIARSLSFETGSTFGAMKQMPTTLICLSMVVHKSLPKDCNWVVALVTRKEKYKARQQKLTVR